MYHSGQFVAEHLTQLGGGEVHDSEIETHGVELGINKIYSLRGSSFITDEEYDKPKRNEIHTRITDNPASMNLDDMSDAAKETVANPHYNLLRGNYVIEYDKIIHIPDDCVGFVYPRSRLMRSGLGLQTAVWESGYEGIGEGGLVVDNQTFIREDTHVGQMVMARAEVLEKYDGSHQGEKL